MLSANHRREGIQIALRLVRMVLVASIAIYVAGCAAAGVIADKLYTPKIPATYVPVKDEMLVLVENFRNPASVSLISEQVDREIAEELISHKVAPIINPALLMEMRVGQHKQYAGMEITAIGKKLGAKQILYADLVEFSVDSAEGAHMSRGRAEVRVRVIDVATGQTRWPTDLSAGIPISVQTPYIALKDGITEGSVREQIAHTLSDRVAKLFYEYSSDEVEPDHAPLAQMGT
jgi:hypothetical protein